MLCSLGSFRFESEFTTWVHRLALNDGLQHLRRKRRRPLVPHESREMPGRTQQPDIENNEVLYLAPSKLDPELRVITVFEGGAGGI